MEAWSWSPSRSVIKVASIASSGAPKRTQLENSNVQFGSLSQLKLGNMAAAAVHGSNVSTGAVSTTGRSGTTEDAVEHRGRNGRIRREDDKEYTTKEEDRPTIAHDEWWDVAEIPVIDLSRAESDKAGVLKQLHDAATEWGFFQIVNHGLPLDVLAEMQAQGMNFFELPEETKEKAPAGTYLGDNSKSNASSLHWAESLQLWVGTDILDKMIGEVWPGGNAEFRDAVTNFTTRAEVINKQLMEFLAESLGLKPDFFSKHLNSKKTVVLRWNHYLPCPRPSEILGANSHTDGCSLTLLQQDKVGGLQIQKDGQWIGIKPIEGALVVNIGDTLHAWTNGIYRSVLHRVVVNKTVPRLSLAAFFSIDRELSVSAPEDLIDASHPRLYRPFTAGDYLSNIIKTRDEDKTQSFSRSGYDFLKAFMLEK